MDDERIADAPPPAGISGWVTRLVVRNRATLVGVAKREGVIEEDALDCVQDAFETFLAMEQARRIAQIDDDARAMLIVLTRNEARNRRRRHDRARVHAPLDDDAQAGDARSADEIIALAEAHAMAVGCTVHLAEVQRRVVALRLVDDLDNDAVADELGISKGHAAVLLHRAKHALRVCMISAGYGDS